jgi:hypothetical protein
MSSPFDPGRDSNAGMGTSFGDESDVGDENAGAFTGFAMRVADDNLNEEDYRP